MGNKSNAPSQRPTYDQYQRQHAPQQQYIPQNTNSNTNINTNYLPNPNDFEISHSNPTNIIKNPNNIETVKKYSS